MTNKLIRCLCGTMYDPARYQACPECGRAAVDQSVADPDQSAPPLAPSPPEAASAHNATTSLPAWVWKGAGIAAGLLLLAFLLKQCSGNGDPATIKTTTPAITESTSDVVHDCDAVVGDWQWFAGGYVHFADDRGAFFKPSKDGEHTLTATWSCDATSGVYTVIWAHGFTDTLRLYEDNRVIRGSNNTGMTVSGKR